MVVIFSFKNWYTSRLKNKTHCLLIFLCYVMQFINLKKDKSEATSQLRYIPLSLFSQIC